MPTLERLRTDDREDRQGRRKPSIQLDQEPAITIDDPFRPGTLRRKTINWCRSAAFSASSRLFDLNGEANTAKTKQSSANIVCTDVR
jgi:hypothetical protein